MPGAAELSESECIMARAGSMIAAAQEGLAQLQHALHALGVDQPRVAAALQAVTACGTPDWLASTHTMATSPAQGTPAPLQPNDTRRVRKHRFMV